MRRPTRQPDPPARLPLVLPPEVQELESAFCIAHDRAAAIRARVEKLAADYRAAVAARNAVASVMIEEEAVDEAVSPETTAKHRLAVAEVERIAGLVEAAGGALTRADLELRHPYERLSAAVSQVLMDRLEEAKRVFDDQATVLAATWRELNSLRHALGQPLMRDVHVGSEVEPDRAIIHSIELDDAIEETIARAKSLLRSYENRPRIRQTDVQRMTEAGAASDPTLAAAERARFAAAG